MICHSFFHDSWSGKNALSFHSLIKINQQFCWTVFKNMYVGLHFSKTFMDNCVVYTAES